MASSSSTSVHTRTSTWVAVGISAALALAAGFAGYIATNPNGVLCQTYPKFCATFTAYERSETTTQTDYVLKNDPDFSNEGVDFDEESPTNNPDLVDEVVPADQQDLADGQDPSVSSDPDLVEDAPAVVVEDGDDPSADSVIPVDESAEVLPVPEDMQPQPPEPLFVDFVVQDVAYAPDEQGDTLLSFMYRNKGTQDAEISEDLRVSVETPSGAIFFYSIDIFDDTNGCFAGGETTVRLSEIPYEEGLYTVCMDADAFVDELDETNNCSEVKVIL